MPEKSISTGSIACPLRQPIAPELSRFQPVERDFSFVFADAVRWQSIAGALG